MSTDLLAQIDAAAKLGEKAIPRPWIAGVDVPARSRPHYAHTDSIYSERDGLVAETEGDIKWSYPDARYIAAACSLPIPAIAARIRELEEENATLRARLGDHHAGD